MRKYKPDIYRKMQEPHETIEDANTAWQTFFEEVGKLRETYRIMDVHVIGKLNFKDGDEESQANASFHYGNQLNALPMLAESYGKAQAVQDRAIADLVNAKKIRDKESH